jgi:hypothetical protein
MTLLLVGPWDFRVPVSVSTDLRATYVPPEGEDRLAAWVQTPSAISVRTASRPELNQYRTDYYRAIRRERIVTHPPGGSVPRMHAQLSVGNVLDTHLFERCYCWARPHGSSTATQVNGTVAYLNHNQQRTVHGAADPPLTLQHGMKIHLEFDGTGRQFDDAPFSWF